MHRLRRFPFQVGRTGWWAGFRDRPEPDLFCHVRNGSVNGIISPTESGKAVTVMHKRRLPGSTLSLIHISDSGQWWSNMQRERSAIGCRYENGGKKMSSEWLSSWMNTRISVSMSGIFTMTKWNICQFFINNFCRSAPERNIVRLRSVCEIAGKNEGIPVITSMPERAGKPLWHVAVWECPSGTMTVCLAKKQKGDLVNFLCTRNRYFFFQSLQDREEAMFCVCAGIGSVFGKAQSRFLRKKCNVHVISTPKAMRTVLIAQRGKNRNMFSSAKTDLSETPGQRSKKHWNTHIADYRRYDSIYGHWFLSRMEFRWMNCRK